MIAEATQFTKKVRGVGTKEIEKVREKWRKEMNTWKKKKSKSENQLKRGRKKEKEEVESEEEVNLEEGVGGIVQGRSQDLEVLHPGKMQNTVIIRLNSSFPLTESMQTNQIQMANWLSTKSIQNIMIARFILHTSEGREEEVNGRYSLSSSIPAEK